MNGNLRNMTAIYLFRQGKVLLLYKEGGRVVNHVWTGSAGGHFEKEELNDAKACVLREMQEELGLTESDVEDMKLRYITLRSKNGEIRQNYYFFGRLKMEKPLQSTEGNLQWFTNEEAEHLHMPASAKHMMLHYLKVGRFDDHLYAGITEESGTKFVIMKDFED